jgi:hypothetical protein
MVVSLAPARRRLANFSHAHFQPRAASHADAPPAANSTIEPFG